MVNLTFRSAWIPVLGILAAFLSASILDSTHNPDGSITGVLLEYPINKSIVDDKTVDFCFYPVIFNGTINRTELWTNETGVMALEETNSTTVVNATQYCITHTVSSW